MRLTRWSHLCLCALPALVATGCAARTGAPAAELRLRNNHELAYSGPVSIRTGLPDGEYRAESGRAEVRDGVARIVATLPAHGEAVLARTGALTGRTFRGGPLGVSATGGRLGLAWAGRALGDLDLGLVVIPGTGAGFEEAVSGFQPLEMRWQEAEGGELRARAERDGYEVELTATPYGGGWLDLHARLVRSADPAGPAYVALVRRVTTPALTGARLRFNGRVLDGGSSPDTWERDFWYTRGVDWVSWRAGDLSVASVSGFTPVPTIQKEGAWVEGSHFYVREESRRDGDRLYLVSQVAGPNRHQAKSRYMPVTPYAPVRRGDALELRWRLAVSPRPEEGWEESQLRGFAGYRWAGAGPAGAAPGGAAHAATVDLGVPGVEFGTAYFPYSTLPENFDFYRTPGLNKETWWAFSPTLWKQWRALAPRMRSDLRIVKAMGFDWVRLHHLELLQEMDRAEALAFLDFFTDEARALGLRITVDTEGPEEWLSLIASRYGDVVTRFELENEIVIMGIKPGDPERWTGLYHAAKRAAPQAEVFLTGAGNNAQFERLTELGVPFDRVGLHAYKHGPEWIEAFASHALGTGGYASDIGKQATLGEFNWKSLTRISPEARRAMVAEIYGKMLEPRAIPEFFEFHFQETLSVNPSIARSGIRHYEPLMLDRRPKPEAHEVMRLIREHARPDAPARELAVEVGEAVLAGGAARVPFRVANRTGRVLSVELLPEAFDGLETRLLTPARLALEPGETADGAVEVGYAPGAEPGTYHHFLRATYEGKSAYGWGIASNPGAPVFGSAPVLTGRVVYPQGAGVVGRVDWRRPVAVVFGADAPVLEMEMAYITANTLQSATGRPVWLSSTADLPDSLRATRTLIVVGTPATQPLLPAGVAGGTGDADGRGVVRLREEEGRQWILLTGESKEAVQAAATDFVLRYWPNAKDAAIRITGMEKGAALGHRAGVTETELP